MDAWKLSNEIEQVGFKLDSVKSIIEMVAERVIDNPESSALWGCSEMIEVYMNRLETLSDKAMDIHRQSKIAKEVTPVAVKATKGKK
jgi:hypothetical protein